MKCAFVSDFALCSLVETSYAPQRITFQNTVFETVFTLSCRSIMQHGNLKFGAADPNASVNFRIKPNFLIKKELEFRSQVCLYPHFSLK
jgi:hypothetical protein